MKPAELFESLFEDQFTEIHHEVNKYLDLYRQSGNPITHEVVHTISANIAKKFNHPLPLAKQLVGRMTGVMVEGKVFKHGLPSHTVDTIKEKVAAKEWVTVHEPIVGKHMSIIDKTDGNRRKTIYVQD